MPHLADDWQITDWQGRRGHWSATAVWGIYMATGLAGSRRRAQIKALVNVVTYRLRGNMDWYWA